MEKYVDSRFREADEDFPRSRDFFTPEKVESLKRGRSLGLSEVSNSSNRSLRYGMQGLTRKGRIEIYETIISMEKTYGAENLAMITATFPRKIGLVTGRQLSSIVEEFNREIQRTLSRLNAETETVYCIEIHEKAIWNLEEIWAHIHLVLVGRANRFARWYLTPAMVTTLWQNACMRVLKQRCDGVSFNSSTQIKGIYKSAASYMAKYMSKGGETLQKFKGSRMADCIPHSWWGRSRAAKKLRETLTISVSGLEAADCLDYLQAHEECPFKYFKYVKVPIFKRNPVLGAFDDVKCLLGDVVMGSYGTLTDWAAAIAREMFPRPAPAT